MKTAQKTQRSKPTGYLRRNFTLRAETAALLDRLPREVNRSRLADEGIRVKIAALAQKRLSQRLEEGYGARAERNLRMVEEWSGVEEEAWQLAERGRKARK